MCVCNMIIVWFPEAWHKTKSQYNAYFAEDGFEFSCKVSIAPFEI